MTKRGTYPEKDSHETFVQELTEAWSQLPEDLQLLACKPPEDWEDSDCAAYSSLPPETKTLFDRAYPLVQRNLQEAQSAPLPDDFKTRTENTKRAFLNSFSPDQFAKISAGIRRAFRIDESIQERIERNKHNC